MKKIILILPALLCSLALTAQKSVEVKESNESFSTGNHNTLSVIVYGAEQDDINKAFKKQLKDLKGSVKAKNEIFADDCSIKKMSKNTFDVYAKSEPVEGGVRIMAAFDLGGAYLNSGEHKTEFPFIKDMMYKFGVQETQAAIGTVIKTEEKTLEGLSSDKKDLEKEVENMTDDIEDYKKKIAENEKAIEEKKTEIAAKKEEIKTQTGVVKSLVEKQKAVK